MAMAGKRVAMDSQHYWTYAEIAARFGVSRRTVSNWIREYKTPVTAGRPARVAPDDLAVLATILGRPFPSFPVVSPAFGKPEEIDGNPWKTAGNVREANGNAEEPLEASYRVTPAEIEQAVSRTSAQYMGDLRTMLTEVGKVYEGQLMAKDVALAAKDETIATKEQVIATQRVALAKTEQALAADALAIAELRRRAEVAEAALAQRREEEARTVELVRRRNEQERLNRERAQAAQDDPGATELRTPDSPSGVASASFWARVRRVFGGV